VDKVRRYNTQKAPHSLNSSDVRALRDIGSGQTSRGSTVYDLDGPRSYELIKQRIFIDTRASHRD
jgi:hypothetical protein